MTEKHQPDISSFSSGEIHFGAQVIISAARQTRNYPYHFMKHIHRSIEIYLIDSGSCAMDINNRKLSCTAGDFVMILPNTVHSFYLDAPDTCLFRHIHFDPAPFSRLYLNRSETDSFDMITALTVPYGHCFHLASNETFSSLIDNIIEETAENDSLHLALANLHLTELLLELMKLTRKNHALLTVSDSLSPEQIRYVSYALSYIHENFDRKILVKDIADHLNISSRYLSKVFFQHMNLTILNYINIYRINQAIDLMLNTDLTLTHISAQVGLKDSQHFSKLFRTIIGLPPNQYRKRILHDTSGKSFLP